jgi:sn-glycerol 3-phosphate transport system substrate-binding protein
MIHRDKTAQLAGREAFLSGEAAMFIDSTALLSTLEAVATQFELGTAFFPHEDGMRPGVPTGGGVAVMPANLSPARQRAAWQFLKWLVSAQQTADLSRRTGYVPVRKSAVESLTLSGFYKEHPNYKTAVDQLPLAREAPTVPAWPTAMGMVNKAVWDCLQNDKPAVDALTMAARDVDRLLGAAGKKKK